MLWSLVKLHKFIPNYGIVIILLNFIVDMLYAWLNPRIRYDEQ